MDDLREGRVADDQERPTELLQQPAVSKSGTSPDHRDLLRQQLACAQLQISRLASGEIHDSMAQQCGARRVVQPTSLRRSLGATTGAGPGHRVPLRNDSGWLYRSESHLSG